MIKVTFGIKQFRSYCLWWVRLRKKAKQRWADATLIAGRTDTECQSWGQVSRLVAGMDLAQLSEGRESWSTIRDYLRKPDESHRFEGVTAWDALRGKLGKDGLAKLSQDGQRFRESWEQHSRKLQEEREQARQHFTAEERLEAMAWSIWCLNTRRDESDRSPEALAAFAKWKADKAEAREREQRQQREEAREWFEQFRRSFALGVVNVRADDLAALGLAPTATAGDIKTTWRRLAMRHHPDRGGDHGEFVRLKAAYERLSGEAGL